MAAAFRGFWSRLRVKPRAVLRGKTGQYCLKQLLHRGGHGEIWAATSLADGAEVAVKLRRPGSDLPASSFQLECDILVDQRFRNPAIVRGLDCGARRNEPFVVMERLGDSLAVLRRRFSWAEYGPILRAMLGALSALHVRGVVHHDVKPTNILVASTDPVTVKLCDFSAATQAGLPLTRDRMNIGTDGYTAPADRVRQESEDLWGLGVTSLHTLCGSTIPGVGRLEPFDEGFVDEIRAAYSAKHGEELPQNVACYLRLLFDAYNADASADKLLDLLGELENGREEFPVPCRVSVPPPAPPPDTNAIALDIAGKKTPSISLQSDQNRCQESDTLRLSWRPWLVGVMCFLLAAAAAANWSNVFRIPAPPGELAGQPLQLPANGGWVFRVASVPITGAQPWSWHNQPLTLQHPAFGVLYSDENSGTLRYENGTWARGDSSGKFKLTRKEPVVFNVVRTMEVEVYAGIEILPERVAVTPTTFELRLPVSELTDYANRQTNKSFATGDLRWEFLDPVLELNGNRIKVQVCVQLTGLPAANRGGVRAIICAEVVYGLKEAERAVDQTLEMSTKLVWVRCQESGGLNREFVEKTLEAILRGAGFGRRLAIEPFRVSDEPVRSMLEHVTVHEVTSTEFNKCVVVRGICRPTKRSHID